MKKLLAELVRFFKGTKTVIKEDAFAKFEKDSDEFCDKIVSIQADVQQIIDGIHEMIKLNEETKERLEQLENSYWGIGYNTVKKESK